MSETPPVPPAPLPRLTLVLGPEELLADRAVAGARRMVRAADPEADVHDLAPAAITPGALDELTAPSLFAQRLLVIIRNAHDLPAAVMGEVEALIVDPPEDVSVVLVHSGGAKGKALVEAARKAGAVLIDCPEIRKPADKLTFVNAEFRAAGRRIGADGAKALLDAVGGDLRELAAACAQLIADTDGVVDADTVHRYYAGRADVTSFAVADLAVSGQTVDALVQLRWALSAGVEPVLITAALAMGLRSIAKLGGAPRGLRPADLARELGMPPWKIDRVRAQLRGWDGEGIARAMNAVAVADAAVKGGAVSAGYALEKALVGVAEARRRG
ncbi:MAG TPA: DNA polymerase III subunit delta [Sporichthyaceae bacterium]|nr:DNA polymerase III subunit delta [Sporichthyaceae bacterium]